METRLYVDVMSQPCRACMVFCRVTGLPVQEVPVTLRLREQRKDAYRAVNALRKVPALQEGDWVLPESCAILRYLCNSRRVDDAWYPVRPRDRARIDAALDWHHATLRRGAAALVFARVFAGNNAEVASDPALRESAAILRLALRQLEEYWLLPGEGAAGGFIGGFAQASVADLVLAAEVAQLDMLPRGEGAALLAPWPRVRAWLVAVAAATAPHWAALAAEAAAAVSAIRPPGAKL